MKKILLAFDSFKGSVSSKEAGEAASIGVLRSETGFIPEVIAVADGGEGTVDAVVDALGGQFIEVPVPGPLNEKVIARYGICGDTAIIEIASACGLTLMPESLRNPEKTSSLGVGRIILDALDKGCRKFRIGLGGSATNDAGVGMLRALGFRFLDSDGKQIGYYGGEVGRIMRIDRTDVDPRLQESEFIVACDVRNPLCGPDGASLVFGAQKGADPRTQKRLDQYLHSFSEIVYNNIGKDYSSVPGVGAAGGLGFAFMAFLNGRLVPGVDMVLDAVGLDDLLSDVALVITGEGKLDKQTCLGKTPMGVLCRANRKGIPVIALGGSVDSNAVDELLKVGFKAVFPIIATPISEAEAMNPETTKQNISRTVAQILRLLNLPSNNL